ncbi:Ribonuclease [Alteracholeplasma palmae J233]|uniref:Ribonuclease n=1 Tax=Alteracholeplasma palmae (strain ATCC 49389 / J233) TaxID=1318466 RepID=U4KL62_ALTPJ|nr:ribonuclease HIII [Alteracholeplasma palmae]CCV64507.1 Ribonuclease [Alteracholeplasma palmae J233]
MKHYTMNLSESQLNQLKNGYSSFIKASDSEAVFFIAEHNQTTITALKNGKVTIEGIEINNELVLIKNFLNIKDYEAVGSSDAGSLDVFGPVVICSTYVSLEDIAFLETLDIGIQRTISMKKIVEIAPIIAKRLTHSIVILKPFKYNELSKNGFNMNKIKSLLNNHMIIKTTAKIDKTIPVILEQYCNPNNYFNYLKEEKLVYRDIEFSEKSETPHISVLVSSIIAKYAYLVEMHRLSKKLNLKLKLGATKDVDEQILEVVNTHGSKVLIEVAKCNFKNITKQNIEF